MKALIILSITLLSLSVHSQALDYHCQYDTRQAAAKQTVDTITSDDGKYAYSVARDIPLTFDIRTTEVIKWYGGTNMTAHANTLMEEAFQDWEDATGVNFRKLGDDENAIWPIKDGKSQVLIADPADLRGASALTQRFGSPTVFEADIGFDPNLAGGATDAFLLSIARHEIGHMLGLQHVTTTTSLMTTTIIQGTSKSIDDGSKAGIAFLYSEKIDLDNLKSAYDESVASGVRDTPIPSRAYTLLADSDAPSDLIIRSRDQVYRSTDGGNEWTPITIEDLPVAGVSPVSPNVSYYQVGFAVYKSEDSGETQSYLAEAPFFGTMHTALVLNDFLVWFATEKGIYKTSDGGQSFLPKNGGLPDEFNALAFVQHPSNPSTFYVGGTEGVYKTVNSATHWTPLPKGLGATTVKDIQVTDDGSVYVLTGIGLYRLSDDGLSWTRLNSTIGTFGLTGISVDPANSDEVFVSSYYGVFRSQNRGTSFSSISVPELNFSPVIDQQLATALALPVETLTIDIDSIATFSDANGDPLTYSVDENSFVSATVDGNQISLTALRVGGSQIRITADDGRGGTATAWITITIAETGAPSVAEQFISFLVVPPSTLTIDVDSIATFSDPNGDPLSYTVTSNQYVSASIEGNIITLTPLQVGSGQISLEADDGRGGVARASMTVRVDALGNRPPTFWELQPQSVQLDQLWGSRSIWLGGSDPDGDDLSFEAISYPDFIKISANADGNFSFTARGPGEGTITWRVDDGNGGEATVDQAISISAPTTGPPIALHYLDTIRVSSDNLTPFAVGLDSLFLDPDGDTLTYTIWVQQPDLGAAEVDGSVVTVTPMSEGLLRVSITATDGTSNGNGQIVIQVGTPPDPPSLVGSVATVESHVGVAHVLDLSSAFSGSSLTFSGSPVDWEAPTVGAFRTTDGQAVFTGAIPGEGEFRIWATDIFGQQSTTTVSVTVSASSDDFGFFGLELDPGQGMQSMHVQEDVAPGDTIVVEALSNIAESGNFSGTLLYDPAHVEPLLDTFIYGESTANTKVTVVPYRADATIVLNRSSDSPTPDLDGDGSVGFGDFLSFTSVYGSTNSPTHDLTGDGNIDFHDFYYFMLDFGKTSADSDFASFSIPGPGNNGSASAALDIDRSGNGLNDGNTSGDVSGSQVTVEIFALNLTDPVHAFEAAFDVDPNLFYIESYQSPFGITIPSQTRLVAALGPSDLPSNGFLASVTFRAVGELPSDLSIGLSELTITTTTTIDNLNTDDVSVSVTGGTGGSGGVSGSPVGSPEPWWDGVRNSLSLSAQLTGAASPSRLFSVSFVVQSEFTESTRISLENPTVWAISTSFTVPSLVVEIRASLNGDFNRDGEVGFADFLEFAGAFGKAAPAGSAEAKYDLDRSGDIGFGDFLIFAGAFGTSV
jgi:hypothetical protein